MGCLLPSHHTASPIGVCWSPGLGGSPIELWGGILGGRGGLRGRGWLRDQRGFGEAPVWGLAPGCGRMRSAPVGSGPPTASGVLGGKTLKTKSFPGGFGGVTMHVGTQRPKSLPRGGGSAGTALWHCGAGGVPVPQFPLVGRRPPPPPPPPPLSPAVVTQRGGPRGARGWQSGPRHAGVGTRRCPDGRCPDGRCPMGGGTRPVPPPAAFSRGFIPGFPKNKNKNRQNEMPQKKPQSGAGAQSRGGVPRCAASGCPRTHAAPPAQIHGKLSVCGVPSMGARGVWGRTVTATRV